MKAPAPQPDRVVVHVPEDVEILSFDLDDTLWPIGSVIEDAERVLIEWMRVRYPRAVHSSGLEAMRELRTRMLERFPHKAHDFTFLRHRALLEQLEAAGYPGAAADAALDIFFEARNKVCAYEDVMAALDRLGRRYRLYALSNGNADLARCGFADRFAGHVNARMAGVLKPDARIFAQLLREAGVPAHRVLHVGDDPMADVAGAMRAGLWAAWINRDERLWPPELPAPNFTIRSLSELAARPLGEEAV